MLDITSERVVVLRPSWSIPGPNGVHRIRSTADRVEAMIDEVRVLAAAHSVPLMWMLTDDTEPADLPERLRRRGILPDAAAPETATMVLGGPVDFGAASPSVTVEDALVSLEAFAATARAQEEGFGGVGSGRGDSDYRTRWEEACAGGSRVFLARFDGVPAGGGTVTVDGTGAILNGGAVAERFRGRGVYRALVAARYQAALEAGAAGVVTHARAMSKPILEHFGFRVVGRRRYFRDPGTAVG